jgi:hypothetical protein
VTRGNRHNWFFLKEGIRAAVAKPIGEAMRAALGSDSDTGTVTQPYRVAGTPNYPSKAKKKRGRTAVERTSIVDAQPERGYTLDELRSLFSSPRRNGARGNGCGASKVAEDFRSLLVSMDAAGYNSDRSRLLLLPYALRLSLASTTLRSSKRSSIRLTPVKQSTSTVGTMAKTIPEHASI